MVCGPQRVSLSAVDPTPCGRHTSPDASPKGMEGPCAGHPRARCTSGSRGLAGDPCLGCAARRPRVKLCCSHARPRPRRQAPAVSVTLPVFSADVVSLDLKSTLRVLYNLFNKYKNAE